MRILLLLWFLPLALFWGWYGLSAYDLNFGTVYLSRELHDLVFGIYGRTIGVEPETIPPMLLSATVVDSALIGGLAAFRWRKSWWPSARRHLQRLQTSGKREESEDTSAEMAFTGPVPDIAEPSARAKKSEIPFRSATTGPALPAE